MQLYYLSQRNNSNVWYVAFRDPVSGKIGTKKSTKCTNKRDAETIAQTWLRDGLPKYQRETPSIFVKYLEAFWTFDTSPYFQELQTIGKDLNRRHANDMKNIVRRYYFSYFGEKRLKEIDEFALQDFLVHLKMKQGLSGSTVNQARNAACVALRFAKRRRLIRSFDFDNVLRCSAKPKERGILERNEVNEIFKAQWRDPRSRLVNLIASMTGMRMGEIRSLQVRDIGLDRIFVRHSWSLDDGGLKSPKTSETRAIALVKELKDAIEEYLDEYPYIFESESFLFPGDFADKPYDQRQITKDFYAVLSMVGIGEKERVDRNIVFHSWRHYCAKNLAAVAPKAVGMRILGHKTSAMFDHYSDHVDQESFDAMKAAIEKGLGSKKNEGNTRIVQHSIS